MAARIQITVGEYGGLHVTPKKPPTFNKRQLINIILITSLCWFCLDLSLLYVFGKHPKGNTEGKINGLKLPFIENAHSEFARKFRVDYGNFRDGIPTLINDRHVNNRSNVISRAIGNVTRGTELPVRLSDIHRVAQHNTSSKLHDLSPEQRSSQHTVHNLTGGNEIFETIQNVDVRSLPWVPSGPGEDGAAVLTAPGEATLVQQGYNNHRFNQYASDRISLERSLKDPRPQKCRAKKYPYVSLPSTSVIICFTDESWSALLRTVHSVLNRSPPSLIHEVILVDDYSLREDMKKPLDEYFQKYPKVKILRLTQREGLIRARLTAVAVAQAPVLTFLDSHVECTVGWLEPLLDRIRQNPRAVISPTIDIINTDNMKYTSVVGMVRGAFNWALTFNWYPLPAIERDLLRNDPTYSIKTPAIAGGLFSISSQYFAELGRYDPGLEIWGGENIEISLKTWMCGGTLEIHPCSHVGHIFRKSQPYKFKQDISATILRNSQRIAETFLGSYKHLFYHQFPHLRSVKFGDVSKRTALLHDLKCNDFGWYLKNVYPELRVPSTNITAEGAIKNAATGMCVDLMGSITLIKVFSCHVLDSSKHPGSNQNLRLTAEGLLEHTDGCLQGDRYGVWSGRECSGSNILHVTHQQNSFIRNKATSECLDVGVGNTVVLAPCDNNKNSQRWTFSVYK